MINVFFPTYRRNRPPNYKIHIKLHSLRAYYYMSSTLNTKYCLFVLSWQILTELFIVYISLNCESMWLHILPNIFRRLFLLVLLLQGLFYHYLLISGILLYALYSAHTPLPLNYIMAYWSVVSVRIKL